MVWQNENLDDLVLLRGDGTPTYMLAVVVDDHDMGVTHVIRGDDHLINAARQKQIYDALGWDVPEHGPHPADPWSRRLEALQAPRRAGGRCLSRHGISAGGLAQLSGPARLEPWRPGDILHRGNDRRVRPVRVSAAQPRASTSPSSKTSTAIISASRTTDRWSTMSKAAGLRSRGADIKPKLNDATRAQLLRAMPSSRSAPKP